MTFKNLFKSAQNELEESEAAARRRKQEYMTCSGCGKEIRRADARANFYACPLCGVYFKIGARRRIKLLSDPESFCEHDVGLAAVDPLDFPEYGEKLEAARAKTRETEAVITGVCRIGGEPLGIFSMEGDFMMGSMGTAVGEKITRLFEYCTRENLPVLGVTVSGGARMQEGMLSLSQMAKTAGAVRRHSDAGNLYVALLTNPTTGGVTASFAMLGDVIIAEPGALVCFAGPRVIEQSLKKKLPDGFGRAEAVLACGFIDDIVERSAQRGYIADMLRLSRNVRGGVRHADANGL
ncbi:MAG: acetyl-CoA carboxylase carboxyl transferase subunit beta [Clostridia bacterium]|nr:acetyl-CoA carboxylase carboxyl transferase subunit beta [Clostridia bacterium]MBQ1982042.1 acetyl-CoA carboxylase carboxyl transferase subunit beta [Clostridia bacterium]MBQ5725109.1 acetyl-CoA carboxylase carboxyl transferase subunit beta [Clostridia bacterium]